jgi:tRNA modification GTPase
VNAFQEDTIVAAATAVAPAGLGVVRLSGRDAIAVGARLFRGADLGASESHRAHHGFVIDAGGARIDEVLALVLRAPRSYTGEDTIELSCHGSPLVVEAIVAAALAAGARLAQPGEFTRRAFLNGKLDLCQAEAVADLIAAESDAGRRAALLQLGGSLSARLHAVRAAVIAVLAEVEASIDFVEEGTEFFDRSTAAVAVRGAADAVDALLATAGDGMLLRSGIRVSLAGAPNVGKSSLFNRLLRTPRSIVTEHPGTTRDVVSETLRVGVLTLALEDTAGLRGATADPVERIGIERSRRSHAEADIVLHVLDASRPVHADERVALSALDPAAAVVVLNKVDVLPAPAREQALADAAGARAALGRVCAGAAVAPPALADGLACVGTSAATGAGIDTLQAALAQLGTLRRLSVQNDALVTINLRHRDALERGRAALAEFERDAADGEPPEILAADLRAALVALGEVSGENVTEEILDAVFARFCIGK